MTAAMSEMDFLQVQQLFERHTGIRIAEHKLTMVENRLASRLRDSQCSSYTQYLERIQDESGKTELGIFIDRLTVHETYFFREPHQFKYLANYLQQKHIHQPLKAWSAACSTGEEVYSLAMVLSDVLEVSHWKVLGTDVSTQAIETAKRCQYELSLAEKIPSQYRRNHCLRGVGKFSDHFILSKAIQQRCHFKALNLLEDDVGETFDIIMLRNVLIYFDQNTQQTLAKKVIEQLNIGGLLLLGHSENILKDHPNMEPIETCIYRKVGE